MKKTYLIFGTEAASPSAVLAIALVLSQGGTNKAQCVIMPKQATVEDLPDLGDINHQVIDLMDVITENQFDTLEDLVGYFWVTYGDRTVRNLLIEAALNEFQTSGQSMPLGWTPEAIAETIAKTVWIKDLQSFEFLTVVQGKGVKRLFDVIITSILEVKLLDEGTKLEAYGGNYDHVEGSPVAVVRPKFDENTKTPWTLSIFNVPTKNVARIMMATRTVVSKTTTENIVLARISGTEFRLASVTIDSNYGVTRGEAKMPEVITFLKGNLDPTLVTFRVEGNTIVFTGETETLVERIIPTLNTFVSKRVKATA